jgi:hypothetical protein
MSHIENELLLTYKKKLAMAMDNKVKELLVDFDNGLCTKLDNILEKKLENMVDKIMVAKLDGLGETIKRDVETMVDNRLILTMENITSDAVDTTNIVNADELVIQIKDIKDTNTEIVRHSGCNFYTIDYTNACKLMALAMAVLYMISCFSVVL